MNIHEQLKQETRFKPSNTTNFNGFDEVVETSGLVMNDARKRMAQHERVLFGFIGAESVDQMQDLQDEIATMQNSELVPYMHRESDGLVHLGDTGCYLLAEHQRGDLLLLGGRNNHFLGFLSLRKDGSDNQYSLGRTSEVLGKRAFEGPNGSEIVIFKDSTHNDVLPGRMFFTEHSTDLQSIMITPDNRPQGIDISLKLTGKQRYETNTRGGSFGDTYSRPDLNKGINFTQSSNPKHHYDISAMICGYD